MRENLYFNHVVPECQITNKVNKDQRDNRKHRSQEKKHSSKLMRTVVFLKEKDTSLWQSQTKLNF